MLRSIALLAAAGVQLLANEDILEPSVLNEVEHALSRAEAVAPDGLPAQNEPEAAKAFARLYETNGLSPTAVAIRLVSAQGIDGRWMSGTNDVTSAAVRTLRRVSGLSAPAGAEKAVAPPQGR